VPFPLQPSVLLLGMDRNTALGIIKRHQDELKALGVVSLSLFGSTARDEASEESDVDVAVRLEGVPSGFAYFGRLDVIQRRLSEVLNTRVDVIEEPVARAKIQEQIDRDRCIAFYQRGFNASA
jgi:uncharacterized protein